MNMNSHVADPASIPLDMLRRYLMANHWQLDDREHRDRNSLDTPAVRAFLQDTPKAKRNFDIYISKSADLEGIELVVPRNREAADYATLVERVLSALAALEDRSRSEVAISVRQVGFDVVRSRIPDTYVMDDSIHLATARNFISGIRNVLASTATTELSPTPYFLRLKREATDYADRCRFGHTFRGSFGFTVESPLEPNLQPPLPGMPLEPPFERRVIQRLARGLTTVSQAVASDSTTPITNSTRTGFSANVCEHFASLVEETSYTQLTFEFAFSPEWHTDKHAEHYAPAFTLGPAHVEVVKAAAKELRNQVKSWHETVYGRVIRLASQVDPSDFTDIMGDREVAILWSSDALGDVTVRASLSPAEYLLALEAHATGRPVEVSGTLERRGRSWFLVNPANFSVPA